MSGKTKPQTRFYKTHGKTQPKKPSKNKGLQINQYHIQ